MKTVSRQAAQVLEQLIEAARTNPEKDNYLKLDRNGPESGIMPVTVEWVGTEGKFELWSIAHYYPQNGDLMRDPEIVFAVPSHNGVLIYDLAFPVEFTQDGMPTWMAYQRLVEFEGGKMVRWMPRAQKDAATFTTTWMRNIKAQQSLSKIPANAQLQTA